MDNPTQSAAAELTLLAGAMLEAAPNDTAPTDLIGALTILLMTVIDVAGASRVRVAAFVACRVAEDHAALLAELTTAHASCGGHAR